MVLVPLSQIKPPKYRLRESLGELEELKASMTLKGLFHPLLIRPVGKSYEIVDGVRRYICATDLGWKEIECNILVLSDKEGYEVGLVMNLQRKSMDPIEEANAFHNYTRTYGWGSASELAEKIAKSKTYVTQTIALLKLPEEIYPYIGRKLKRSQAESISALDTENVSVVLDKVMNTELTVKETQLAVDLVKHGMAPEMAIQTAMDFPDLKVKEGPIDVVEEAREKIYLVVDRALQDVDFNLQFFPEGAEKKAYIDWVRYPLHEVKSGIIRVRKEFKKK